MSLASQGALPAILISFEGTAEIGLARSGGYWDATML